MTPLSEALTALQIPATQSLVLSALQDTKCHSFHDIERITGLRQYEVSFAVKALSDYLEFRVLPKVPDANGRTKTGRHETGVRMSKANWEKSKRELMRDVTGRHDAAMKAMRVVME